MDRGAFNKIRLGSSKEWLRIFFSGICMGAADIVPGISGGTIAFIMGFYHDLLLSIKSFDGSAFLLLFKGQFKRFSERVSWEFLSALIGGIAFAMILLAGFFDHILGHEFYRVFLYAGFLGLILASVVLCAKQLSSWKLRHFLALAIGGGAAFFLTGTELNSLSKEPLFDVSLVGHPNAGKDSGKKLLRNYDRQKQMLLNVPTSTLAAMLAKNAISSDTLVYSHESAKFGLVQDFEIPMPSRGINWWIVCCGAIAISAMLLPGISGSYLLTILGMYSIVIGALADFVQAVKSFSFDMDAFLILTSMLLGIMVGALLFSRVVVWLLRRYHDLTIALLTGFMIGALQSVWPFWSYAYQLLPLKLEKGAQLVVLEPLLPSLASPLFWVALLICLLGFSAVFIVEFLAAKKSAVQTATFPLH